ncbi:MAG: glycosyl transferase family 2 [Lachnospiraceae bacterium]|jgi:rhamnosyltransferase|nr:glycosyl transferase family 2 [Lachnospiraceae bacterium]
MSDNTDINNCIETSQQNPIESLEKNLSIDVIIPVYKPDIKFKHLIERLTKQSVKPKHIRLLHTLENYNEQQVKERQTTEDMFSYAKGLSTSSCIIECIDIAKDEFDHGGTRNFGASLSQGDIIIFMTQDAVPVDKELIKQLIRPFRNPQVAAAYGRQLAGEKAGVIEQYTRMFNYPKESYVKSKEDLPELGVKTYFCSNVCSAYRKEVYDNLGGFVTKTIFNEDMIMAAGIINSGYSIAYAAEAKVIHSHTYSYLQQFKRNFDLAVSQKQYREIFDAVKSEKEGLKLIIKTMKYLLKMKKGILIPDLFLQSGFKYLGYLAGKNYDIMPIWLVRKLSMNPGYWK